MVAEVYINLPVKKIARAFTYRVPEKYSHLQAGWRVIVPFSHRLQEGFVIRLAADLKKLSAQSGGPAPLNESELKEISGIVDETPWFTPKMIEAALWLSEQYLCAPAEMLRLFMPGKSGVAISKKGITKREKAIFSKFVSLADTAPSDTAASPKVSRLGEKQKALLDLLKQNGPKIDQAVLKNKYGISAATIAALCARHLVTVHEERVLRDSYKVSNPVSASEKNPDFFQNAPPLTEEQQSAIQALASPLVERKYAPFLLYGVTGSGKTRIYIEAAARTLAAKRQAIILVPEIALTGQLVAAFKDYFAGNIVVLHSRLSVAERADAVRRVKEQGIGIIIGARSALFTPVDDLGLIILDEEQDMSYKQDEAPRYHARVVAEGLAKIYESVLILGSATPSLETAYRTAKGEISLLKLSKRIGGRELPAALAVDMRQELKSGNRRIISRELRTLITETIAAKGQLILMLNRRGYSTFIMCRSCGYVVKCPDCGLPMVYHLSGRLACHHCDTTAIVPAVCPTCASKYIRYFGTGTEKLEQELKELVPTARVIRMDRDTTKGKFSHQEILNAFRQGEYDILLGTQMVAKGHDIPRVTAVGVISADSALNLPDFRAAERTFMLITQTAGRAGRGEKKGRVIVQGYNPTHYAVTSALEQNYGKFYRAELAMRQELFFPPFCRLIKLIFTATDEDKARLKAAEFVGRFRARFGAAKSRSENQASAPLPKKNQIIGPAPALVSCLRGVYRYTVLIKSAELTDVCAFLTECGLNERDDCLIDIDPINTM